MLYKKILYVLLTLLFIILAVSYHGIFIFPILLILHLLFNETDFLHFERQKYRESDLDKLICPEAGPVEINNGSSKAIIFIHGFPSSPATFKYVIPHSVERGYDVYVPLLPGFGTVTEDFLDTNFTQWYSYVKDYYQDKRKKYDKVYVVGISLGGALTLKLAQDFSDTRQAPDAISITSTPVFTNSLIHGVYKSYLLYFVRSLSWFVKFIDKKSESWKKMEDNHNQWIGYRGLFPVQSYSIKIAIEKVRENLKQVTIPIIAFHAPEDRTVNYKSFPFIEKKISSERKVFKTVDYSGWYNTLHILFLYESIRDNLIRDILDFFDKVEG